MYILSFMNVLCLMQNTDNLQFREEVLMGENRQLSKEEEYNSFIMEGVESSMFLETNVNCCSACIT